jgi:hypothetical protein
MRIRIDRFIDDALQEFANWYVSSPWLGKERDCVNMYAMKYLTEKVKPGAAINHLSQIRIECAVPQPDGYTSKSATKDLVVWREIHETTWDDTWQPVNVPRVVMEWKTRRRPRSVLDFDTHDMEWLKAFTKQNPSTFGYLVTVCHRREERFVAWAKVSKGIIATSKQVPL